jgi:hypothetical protein
MNEPKMQCPDCGAEGERRGHMTCLFPTDEEQFLEG